MSAAIVNSATIPAITFNDDLTSHFAVPHCPLCLAACAALSAL